MDLKKLLVLSLVVLTILVSAEPAGALLWPPVIGTCGLGGLFGPFGLDGPFGPYGIYSACGPFAVPFGVTVWRMRTGCSRSRMRVPVLAGIR